MPRRQAVRLLDQLKIPYELREYEVDPEDLAAETVAAKIELPPEQVFKTLLARGDRNGMCMAVIPGNAELDLKALAAATGDRKIQLAPVKELQSLPDTFAAASQPSPARKTIRSSSTKPIELFDVISISAGIRGLQILLTPADYIRATKATIARLAHSK